MAGAVPGSGEAGANIDLTTGNFTFGNPDQFIRFNSNEGLVQGGVQTFTAEPRIYRAVALNSTIDTPGAASGFFNNMGSFNFAAPSGWSRTIPTSVTQDVYEADGFASGRASSTATPITWGTPQLLRPGSVSTLWTLRQTGSTTFSYSSSSDFTPSPGSRTVVVTATQPGTNTVETASFRVAVNLGSISNLNASRFSLTEFNDTTNSFTVTSQTFNAIATDMATYTVVVRHDSGTSITITYMLVGNF